MGVFLLSKGIWVKAGLVGTMIFVIGLVPIHFAQLAWVVSIAANIFLLTKKFDISFIKMISTRFYKK